MEAVCILLLDVDINSANKHSRDAKHVQLLDLGKTIGEEVDQESTELTKVKRNKGKSVTPIQNFPDYLKFVARRSKAGFDKVHEEIQRIRRDTMTSNSHSKVKLRQRWSVMVKSGPLWSSTGSIKTSPGCFTSYIQEEDTHIEDTSKGIEKTNSPDKLLLEKNVNSPTNFKTELHSARQLKLDTKRFDFENTKVKMQSEVNGQEKISTRNTNDCKCDIPREQTVHTHIYSNQHEVSNIEEVIYAVPGKTDSDRDGDALEESNEYVDMDDYHDMPGPKVYRPGPQVNRGDDQQVYSNLGECFPAEQDAEFDYVNCPQGIHTHAQMQQDSIYINSQENGKPVLKPRIPHNGLEHMTKKHFRKAKRDASNITGTAGTSKESFYDFSVDELVKCLNDCALSQLALICEEEKLDGEYFKTITKDDLGNEPFKMNWFYISKLFRVIDGWRPKQTV